MKVGVMMVSLAGSREEWGEVEGSGQRGGLTWGVLLFKTGKGGWAVK